MIVRRHRSGFTLTELAIVLAVIGVLAAGLWNLLSGANEQVRDQSAANQQTQLVGAVKAFLNSANGQAYMTGNNVTGGCGGSCGTAASFALPLPSTTACTDYLPATDANWKFFCDFLPPGFTSATTNSYRQTYKIRVLRDNVTALGMAPSTYSFIILATGGIVIPDTSGARVSSLIGGDGGFIFNNNVCGASSATVSMACGAFGGWSANILGASPGGYAFAAGTYTGSIASRSYVSPQQNSFFSWLARVPISGDTAFSLNSMTTPEYIGGTADTRTNELNMGSFASGSYNVTSGLLSGTTTGGGTLNLEAGVINFGYGRPILAGDPVATTGTMNMQGGTINVGGGTITGMVVPGNPSPLALTATGASAAQPLVALSIDGHPTNSNNAPIVINTLCTASAEAADSWLGSATLITPGCTPGIQINGDENVLGELSANALYANYFIYGTGAVTSDMRLKKDIHPIHNGLDEVEKLKPVSYILKSTDKPSMGFLAQDIENVYPDLVVNDGRGYKAVNYNGLIAPMAGAIQDLKKENDDLRAQLREQQKRQDDLEKKLDAIRD